jgi:competence protein ComEA
MPGTSDGSAGSQPTRLINLNSATASELDSLTGVGPSTAKAIIAYRTKKGSFSKVEDLLNVPGIGPAKLAALRDQVTVG